MMIPVVKGYMPLGVTPGSQVCDIQGVGSFPMWQRYESVKGVVDQYIDEPYREFLALPFYDVDKQEPEEYFFWYTPRSSTQFCRLSKMGKDHDYYKEILKTTLKHYYAIVDELKAEGKAEEANFLQLSLKYAGDSEEMVYCGNDRVVAIAWGMRSYKSYDVGESKVVGNIDVEPDKHTVSFDLGNNGTTGDPVSLSISHGAKLPAHHVPKVMANEGFEFVGWDHDPEGIIVMSDLLFVAQYKEVTPPVVPVTPVTPKELEESEKEESQGESPEVPETPETVYHHVRFLSPFGIVIKEFDVKDGEKISQQLIPPLPMLDNIQCPKWDGDPMNDVINSDRDYKAIAPEVRRNVSEGTTTDDRCGFWRALLNWLLLILGILLLGMLLWFLIAGDRHFNFCGCDCNPVEIPKRNPYDPNNTDPNSNTDPDSNTNPFPMPDIDPDQIPPPEIKTCNEAQKAGSNTPVSFVFDLGQDSGTFVFEYGTGNHYPDLILIYEGEDSTGKEIFRYYDVSGYSDAHLSTNIEFHNSKIYVLIVPSTDSGTRWEIKVNCPN